MGLAGESTLPPARPFGKATPISPAAWKIELRLRREPGEALVPIASVHGAVDVSHAASRASVGLI
jgi:hypothetical protein